MSKSGPINFLIENKTIILETHKQNEGKPKKTWDSLERKLPELSHSMSFNTFKQYLSVFAALSSELDKVIQTGKPVIQKLYKLDNAKIELSNKRYRGF